MKTALYFKIGILVLALFGVIYVISNLNQNAVDHFFQSMGMEANSQPKGLGATAESLSLCRTRVTAIVWPDGRKIEEQKSAVKVTWMSVDPKPREIGSLEVERWFSRHCRVSIVKSSPETAAQPTGDNFPTFVFEYVDGSSSKLEKLTDDLYRFDGTEFRSKDLSKAIEELEQAAQFGNKLSA
jgi:hypothetical protein